MLVLSRRKGEKIVIGKDIVITVVEVRGDKIRLGIEAPHSVPVHRQEIHEQINGETNAVDQEADAQLANEDAKDLKW